ncbi:MAG: transglycosylase domain-containing protein [Deltaproteobacteria bacterium]|nr:transglycosylase domain-containing protein [Deltaproteobacteria bacterium]
MTACLTLLALSALLGAFWLSLDLAPDPLSPSGKWDYTVSLTDRRGRLLREILPPPQSRRRALDLKRFSPILVEAVLAAEDKRFRFHPGVDPLAILRAAWINLKSWRIKSGGSTITMQAARLSVGLAPGPRTLRRKMREVWLALIIERQHTKDEILAFYLNSAPAGGPNLGFEAAAIAWLGKSAANLSPSEAALLAAIPASPGSGRGPSAKILARRASILDRLEAKGAITRSEARRARAETLAKGPASRAFLAPHFVEAAASLLGEAPEPLIATTLDISLQERIERLARATVARYRDQGLSQAAVVVMSLPSREILAWVGSADFFDPLDGQIDGVLTPRQPGSALKPLIYALGLEAGEIYASSMLSDVSFDYPAAGGFWRPANYSGRSHGLVSARVALASSLNLPAVSLTMRLGVDRVLARLRELGLESLTENEDFYGLGLALGDGEVTLLSLASAYAALADQGRYAPPVIFMEPFQADPAVRGQSKKSRSGQSRSGQREGASPYLMTNSQGSLSFSEASLKSARPRLSFGPSRQVMSPQAAYIVSDILEDNLARATGFGSGGPLRGPWPIPVKTGTSKNFRDNWCLGYTRDYVIGVWAGNFQARPMNKISGVTGAGHLWRAVADLLTEGSAPRSIELPEGVSAKAVCPVTGLLAGPDCPNRLIELFIDSLPLPLECDHKHEGGDFYPGLNASISGAAESSHQKPKADEALASLEFLEEDRGALGSLEDDKGAFEEAKGALSGDYGSGQRPRANLALTQDTARFLFKPAAPLGDQKQAQSRAFSQAEGQAFSQAEGQAERGAPLLEGRLLSPRSGDIFAWDPGLPEEYQRLRAVIEGGQQILELVVFLDGREISRQSLIPYGRAAALVPVQRGRHTLEARFLTDGGEVGRDRVWYDVR